MGLCVGLFVILKLDVKITFPETLSPGGCKLQILAGWAAHRYLVMTFNLGLGKGEWGFGSNLSSSFFIFIFLPCGVF